MTRVSTVPDRRLALAAWLLVVTQLVHGFTPAHTGEHTIIGPAVGLVLLATSIISIVGFRSGRSWARPLLGWTGAVVAVGFMLYHALPISSPATNPYFGKSVPVAAWISVGLAIAAGLWAAALSFRASGYRWGDE